MRILLFYAIGAAASLFILGYTVHMFVGGLVSKETEVALIAAAVFLGLGVIAFMTWDVLKKRGPHSR